MSEPIQYADAVDDQQGHLPTAQPCDACGAPLDPDDKFCTACGAGHDRAGHDDQVTAEAVEGPAKHFRCQTCGAEVAVDVNVRSYICPFCDSTYVVEYSPESTGRQPPEFVLGFAVTPEQALQKFHQWLAANPWYRPSDLKQAQIAEKLKGVYLPFWCFSTLAQSVWSARIGMWWYKTETYTTTVNGKRTTRTRRVRHTEWWPLRGRHHKYYSAHLSSGSKGLPQQEADRIKPFHLAGLHRYEPKFLAGWMSEEYSVDRDEAWRSSQAALHQAEQQAVKAFLPGDESDSLSVQTDFQNVNHDLILLPVYLLSYRYHDRLYRFLVNGQTGKTSGDKPISKTRIALAVGAALLLIALFVLALSFLNA